MTLKGIKAFILKATKHFNASMVIMAPFQNGFKDLAQLVNFCYISKLTIKTDVSFFTTLSKQDVWRHMADSLQDSCSLYRTHTHP